MTHILLDWLDLSSVCDSGFGGGLWNRMRSSKRESAQSQSTASAAAGSGSGGSEAAPTAPNTKKRAKCDLQRSESAVRVLPFSGPRARLFDSLRAIAAADRWFSLPVDLI